MGTTGKNGFPLKIDGNRFTIPIEGDRLPLEGGLNRQMSLADVFRNSERIRSFKFSDALNYSYIRYIRFVIVICIIGWYYLWTILTPFH